ncbi:hypothetical protein K388_07299 [Streptomyces sp. KhCrAH-43]|uniref:hypothetical protein n=1 Tax=unclassified Streptomyces TaxID=2593676 RepID=UPI0003697292|nr:MULTISPECIES: hypothetical protein [unclassified Streptomyces]MYS36361.1 hypothetical protein [Streptomyces sp. SID4920]MYX64133.1 hypothetical protein [Streptomyces sp. SID8373]RAJ45726.1 hypothetical protein K388_07299 [Streptomyces sp. KhCrAH-43]
MTHALPQPTDETGAAAAAAAVRDLNTVFIMTSTRKPSSVTQQSEGGVHVQFRDLNLPHDATGEVAWLHKDITRNLARAGITAQVQLSSSMFPTVDITLPTTGDVRRFASLVESGMSDLRRVGLHLRRAMIEAGVQARVLAWDRDGTIELLRMEVGAALDLYKVLGGAPGQPAGIDTETWSGVLEFADHLANAIHRASGLSLFVDPKPACGSCREPNRMVFSSMDADEAKALTAAVVRRGAPAQTSSEAS